VAEDARTMQWTMLCRPASKPGGRTAACVLLGWPPWQLAMLAGDRASSASQSCPHVGCPYSACSARPDLQCFNIQLVNIAADGGPALRSTLSDSCVQRAVAAQEAGGGPVQQRRRRQWRRRVAQQRHPQLLQLERVGWSWGNAPGELPCTPSILLHFLYPAARAQACLLHTQRCSAHIHLTCKPGLSARVAEQMQAHPLSSACLDGPL